ncbi:MAG: hypothetical protein Q8R44_01865 [Novosphingobium sp.]|nr:hypothetical protein [Novosphingobium sp.]
MADFQALLTGFHPLQSDEDASPEALMLARSRSSLAWGRLQGLVAHLDPGVASLFAASTIRAQLIEALRQAGHADAASHFELWFCELKSASAPTPHVFAPARAIVDAILAELSLAHWEPVALTARQLREAVRTEHAIAGPPAPLSPGEVIELAGELAASAGVDDDTDWPLAAADRLHAHAAASPVFAPAEPERRLLDLPAGPVAFEQPRARVPLWAIDLAAGKALARCTAGMVPLPCPGAVRAEALAPWLWPRERGILVADALARCSERLAQLVASARTSSRAMTRVLADLRSTSRAPALYTLLAGFGPLRPNQIERALKLSKNGARELVKTLNSAGLASAERHRNQVLIRAASPDGNPAPGNLARPDSPALSADSLAEFDSAMADIDRLLARSGNVEDQNETDEPSR